MSGFSASPTMVGDTGFGGTKGLVPAPGAGDAAAGKFLKADGTFAVPAGGGGGSNIVNLLSYAAGTPGGSAKLLQAITPQATTFAASLTGSYAYCDVAPTAAVTCTINKISGGTTTAIGSINFAIGATSATFTFASPVTTALGDIIQVVAPATPDATFAGAAIALVGTR